MPDKLILETTAGPDCIASDGKVFIEIDGVRKQLKRVKSMVVRADNQGVIEADLTVYAADLTTEVVITRANADAILAVEYGRQLAFLTDADAAVLLAHRKPSSEPIEDNAFWVAFEKLCIELDKRQEIPF